MTFLFSKFSQSLHNSTDLEWKIIKLVTILALGSSVNGKLSINLKSHLTFVGYRSFSISIQNGGLAEWSKAADLRSAGRCPREFEPRILHYFFNFCQYVSVVTNIKANRLGKYWDTTTTELFQKLTILFKVDKKYNRNWNIRKFVLHLSCV